MNPFRFIILMCIILSSLDDYTHMIASSSASPLMRSDSSSQLWVVPSHGSWHFARAIWWPAILYKCEWEVGGAAKGIMIIFHADQLCQVPVVSIREEYIISSFFYLSHLQSKRVCLKCQFHSHNNVMSLSGQVSNSSPKIWPFQSFAISHWTLLNTSCH